MAKIWKASEPICEKESRLKSEYLQKDPRNAAQMCPIQSDGVWEDRREVWTKLPKDLILWCHFQSV